MVFNRKETEILIREVEKRPILWNLYSGEQYGNRSRKQVAWYEVCGILFKDFPRKDDAKRKTKLREVTSRWRTLRDNYVRKRKKINEHQKLGYSGDKIKKYRFDEQLSFLQTVFRTSRQQKKVKPSNRILEEDYSNLGGDYSNLEQDYSNLQQDNSNLQQDNSNQGQDSSTLDQNSQNSDNTSELILDHRMPSTSDLQKPIKKEAQSPTPADEAQKCDAPKTSEDEDMAFFVSLLPTVRKLNTIEKFDFRIQAMQFLRHQLKQRSNNDNQTDSSRNFQFAEFSVADDESTSHKFLLEND